MKGGGVRRLPDVCDNRRGWLTGHGPYFVGFVVLIIDCCGCNSWLEVGDLLDCGGDLMELYCGLKKTMQSVSSHVAIWGCYSQKKSMKY